MNKEYNALANLVGNVKAGTKTIDEVINWILATDWDILQEEARLKQQEDDEQEILRAYINAKPVEQGDDDDWLKDDWLNNDYVTVSPVSSDDYSDVPF